MAGQNVWTPQGYVQLPSITFGGQMPTVDQYTGLSPNFFRHGTNNLMLNQLLFESSGQRLPIDHVPQQVFDPWAMGGIGGGFGNDGGVTIQGQIPLGNGVNIGGAVSIPLFRQPNQFRPGNQIFFR